MCTGREWTRKLRCIYTMQYYSAIKKNAFESVLMRWMKLEPIIQGEVSQKEKHQWNSSTLATSCEELTHWKRLWCWEGLGARGEGDNRGWDGWMASLTGWMWVWVNSGSWWWTGRPGVLRFMGSQRVGHDWATDLIWSDCQVTINQGCYRNVWSPATSWVLPASFTAHHDLLSLQETLPHFPNCPQRYALSPFPMHNPLNGYLFWKANTQKADLGGDTGIKMKISLTYHPDNIAWMVSWTYNHKSGIVLRGLFSPNF